MVNWTNVLSKPVGQNAVRKFALGELSCKGVQKVFRVSKDREVSGQINALIRTKGAKIARKTAKEALRRRSLI